MHILFLEGFKLRWYCANASIIYLAFLTALLTFLIYTIHYQCG